ncbi:MAG: hypothetical protein DRN15_02035 [Thermoprotei archaeon]|nr:MAG: hypothetical protein DRM97_06415 [Thermoprotei archaeon]RLF24738.1 MAG: hypothetical protein DRN15_02035 [Thermoprotei archaeon]
MNPYIYYYVPPLPYSPYWYLMPYPLMYDLFSLLMATYYWWLFIDVFRTAIEAWRKAFETAFKPPA